MKRKFGLSILLVSTSLTLMSCGFKIDVSTLKSISISDQQTYYQVGQTYLDSTDLTITGNYSDKGEVNFSYEDVNYKLTCDGKSYNPREAFTVAGIYSLRVVKDSITSNKITFEVGNDPIYVNDFTVEGDSSVSVNGKKTLSLTVDPIDFTVPITASVSDESKISLTKISNFRFDVVGLIEGNVTITFSASKSETDYCTKDFNIEVTEITPTAFNQSYYNVRNSGRVAVAPCPLSGDLNVLVIPMWFTDSSNFISEAKKENVREDIIASYNGDPDEIGFHSVKSFYYEESGGTLNINCTVSEWWETSMSSNDAANVNDNSRGIIRQATSWYFSNHDDSRTNYDLDGDGYIDSVMVIYGSPDQSLYHYDCGDKTNMWAFCFWICDTSLKNPSNPGPNSYFWASYDFLYSNGSYAKGRTGSTYGRGNTSHCVVDAHTYIHEMGHIFGLDDYYDYNYVNNVPNTNPAGGFSMQDNNVGAHDPFSVLALGWGDAYIPSNSCEVTLTDFQSSHTALILSPQFNTYSSPFDEYLLLELYTPTGLNRFDTIYKYGSYPQGPNAVGIRLWHVDARLCRAGGYYFTSDATTSNIGVALNNNSVGVETERICLAGSSYQNYNLLHLIRNNSTEAYDTKDNLVASDLFYVGDSFSLSDYSSQFYKSTTLDNGKNLGWEFTVSSIFTLDGVNRATISLERI